MDQQKKYGMHTKDTTHVRKYCMTNILAGYSRGDSQEWWRGEKRMRPIIISDIKRLAMYCITRIFGVGEIFAIFANLDFARNFPPAK